MTDSNIKMLQIVAKGFGELKDKMVFVGGAVAELYVSNPGASDIRPTLDVDCIIELKTKLAHDKLEKDLRNKGFAHDTSQGAPICRWVYKGIKVDVMPSDPRVLGFTNKWCSEGLESKIIKSLPNGTEIYVFSPVFYLAAKLEAHKGRGGNDFRQSHDFEDIIYLMDDYPKLLEDIGRANDDIKTYLKQEFQKLLENENLTEGIECALPYGSDSESTELIVERIQSIADMEV